MGQVRHGSATTTFTGKAAINPKTLAISEKDMGGGNRSKAIKASAEKNNQSEKTGILVFKRNDFEFQSI